MARKIGTWLAKVYEAGSNLILGNVIGIKIPRAESSADTVIIFTLFKLFKFVFAMLSPFELS
ncbi:MAG TPA: hypothetical protein PK304_03220 [Mobilitalea sp.]|nr:hypothetical protein [Mobilitalea sp.]